MLHNEKKRFLFVCLFSFFTLNIHFGVSWRNYMVFFFCIASLLVQASVFRKCIFPFFLLFLKICTKVVLFIFLFCSLASLQRKEFDRLAWRSFHILRHRESKSHFYKIFHVIFRNFFGPKMVVRKEKAKVLKFEKWWRHSRFFGGDHFSCFIVKNFDMSSCAPPLISEVCSLDLKELMI